MTTTMRRRRPRRRVEFNGWPKLRRRLSRRSLKPLNRRLVAYCLDALSAEAKKKAKKSWGSQNRLKQSSIDLAWRIVCLGDKKEKKEKEPKKKEKKAKKEKASRSVSFPSSREEKKASKGKKRKKDASSK